MKHSPLAALALAASLASNASAQSLGTSWSRTFFGCDEMRSCHRVTFDMAPDPSWPYHYQQGTVHWQSWFFTPGVAWIMGVTPFNYFGYEFAGVNTVYSWYDEGADLYNAEFADWRPTLVHVSLSYGKLGDVFPEEDFTSGATLSLVSSTTVTPEPASLLLLAAGLGGMAALVRRRRRFTSDAQPSA